MSVVSLRPYQEEALRAVDDARAAGRRRVLVALPTGCGKTIIFAQLPSRVAEGARTLVLAHREELLDQAARKIAEANPDLGVGVEQADRRAENAEVVVASVGTLGRRGSPRLRAFDPTAFPLVVIDEAHHATAPSYRTVLEHFRAFEADGAFVVGVTATPERGDGQGLEEVFEQIVYAKDIREMIETGYLAPLRAWRVRTNVDLKGVSVRAGDFAENELAAKVNVAPRNELVVASYRAHADGRRAITFTVNVEHAHVLADTFQARGVPAAAVSGDMPTESRRSTLAAFRDGALRVVTNCGVLTEGFDDPGVAAILMARPTKSGLLYRQCIGRGTRLAPGKADCVIVDFVDATRHQLCGAHSLLGIPETEPLEGRDLIEVARDAECRKRRKVEAESEAVSEDEVLARSEAIELFLEAIKPDPAIEGATTFGWLSLNEDSYRLDLGHAEFLSVSRGDDGLWRIKLHRVNRPPAGGRETFSELRDAIRAADRWLREVRPQALVLVELGASWRRERATESQLAWLKRMGIAYPERITKGEATIVINRLFARRSA
ncbi:MAG TPA: DEAD/DEAH box helicase [Planctomycetota bacterium]|nr:DEAD/DEAH box helicase [Planctomycetota bacterium]